MNIYITRHGQTDWNTYWKLQGRSDIELNNKGLEQARLTGQGFIDAGIKFDRVYSSPLKRAFYTAVLMSNFAEEKIIKDDRIIEFNFGKAEGKTPDERGADSDLKDFHYLFDDPEKYKPQDGAESFETVLERTNKFWQDEILPLEKNTDIENILVVTHGGTMQSLLLNIDGRELKDFWKVKMPNCTVNKIVLKDGKFNLQYTGKTFYPLENDNSAGYVKS